MWWYVIKCRVGVTVTVTRILISYHGDIKWLRQPGESCLSCGRPALRCNEGISNVNKDTIWWKYWGLIPSLIIKIKTRLTIKIIQNLIYFFTFGLSLHSSITSWEKLLQKRNMFSVPPRLDWRWEAGLAMWRSHVARPVRAGARAGPASGQRRSEKSVDR